MDKFFVLLGENPLLWGQVCHLRELGYKVILVAWSEQPRIKGDSYIQKTSRMLRLLLPNWKPEG